MKANQTKNVKEQELDQVELITIDGGVTDDGRGGGCIPNPFDKLFPKFPQFPTEQALR